VRERVELRPGRTSIRPTDGFGEPRPLGRGTEAGAEAGQGLPPRDDGPTSTTARSRLPGTLPAMRALALDSTRALRQRREVSRSRSALRPPAPRSAVVEATCPSRARDAAIDLSPQRPMPTSGANAVGRRSEDFGVAPRDGARPRARRPGGVDGFHRLLAPEWLRASTSPSTRHATGCGPRHRALARPLRLLPGSPFLRRAAGHVALASPRPAMRARSTCCSSTSDRGPHPHRLRLDKETGLTRRAPDALSSASGGFPTSLHRRPRQPARRVAPLGVRRTRRLGHNTPREHDRRQRWIPVAGSTRSTRCCRRRLRCRDPSSLGTSTACGMRAQRLSRVAAAGARRAGAPGVRATRASSTRRCGLGRLRTTPPAERPGYSGVALYTAIEPRGLVLGASTSHASTARAA